MDEIDKLLAGIENPQPPKSKPAIAPSNSAGEGSIDELLLGLDELVKRNVRQQLSSHQHPPIPAAVPPAVSYSKSSQAMHSLLSQVRAEQNETAQAELLKQQEIEQEQQHQENLKRQRLEQLKAQQREAMEHEAQRWLNKLQPQSEEGRWFEEFACNYESRLEAAIDYLEALQEVNDMLPRR